MNYSSQFTSSIIGTIVSFFVYKKTKKKTWKWNFPMVKNTKVKYKKNICPYFINHYFQIIQYTYWDINIIQNLNTNINYEKKYSFNGLDLWMVCCITVHNCE